MGTMSKVKDIGVSLEPKLRRMVPASEGNIITKKNDRLVTQTWASGERKLGFGVRAQRVRSSAKSLTPRRARSSGKGKWETGYETAMKVWRSTTLKEGGLEPLAQRRAIGLGK